MVSPNLEFLEQFGLVAPLPSTNAKVFSPDAGRLRQLLSGMR
jgi:hypothetical protein